MSTNDIRKQFVATMTRNVHCGAFAATRWKFLIAVNTCMIFFTVAAEPSALSYSETVRKWN